MGFSFGSDPEFMIMRNSDGALVSAIKALPGFSKDNKLQINEGQFMFYDNVLLEMNVRPAKTLRDFLSSLAQCYDFSRKVLSKKNLSPVVRASAEFPLKECEDLEACVFGCDPEYCIYKKTAEGKIMRVEPPALPMGNTFRSCGGHIHIGHLIATVEYGNPAKIVKLMDGFVGNTAILLDKDPTSPARRKLYGGAGTHRISSYGLEYRTLSNFWLAAPRRVEVIYNLTRFVIQQALTNPDVIDKIIDDKDLQTIINEGKKNDAKELYKKTARLLPIELQGHIESLMVEPNVDGLEYEWSRIKREAA